MSLSKSKCWNLKKLLTFFKVRCSVISFTFIHAKRPNFVKTFNKTLRSATIRSISLKILNSFQSHPISLCKKVIKYNVGSYLRPFHLMEHIRIVRVPSASKSADYRKL